MSWRYFRALGLLKTGKFPEAKGGIMMLSATVAAATLAAAQLAPGALGRRSKATETKEETLSMPPTAK